MLDEDAGFGDVCIDAFLTAPYADALFIVDDVVHTLDVHDFLQELIPEGLSVSDFATTGWVCPLSGEFLGC